MGGGQTAVTYGNNRNSTEMSCSRFELNPRSSYGLLAAKDEVNIGALQGLCNFPEPFRARRNAVPVRGFEHIDQANKIVDQVLSQSIGKH